MSLQSAVAHRGRTAGRNDPVHAAIPWCVRRTVTGAAQPDDCTVQHPAADSLNVVFRILVCGFPHSFVRNPYNWTVARPAAASRAPIGASERAPKLGRSAPFVGLSWARDQGDALAVHHHRAVFLEQGQGREFSLFDAIRIARPSIVASMTSARIHLPRGGVRYARASRVGPIRAISISNPRGMPATVPGAEEGADRGVRLGHPAQRDAALQGADFVDIAPPRHVVAHSREV